ncbi:MAG: hypothetical protein OQL17_04775 [Sedimenticola sp.]|nr:hypothetical protein [Sedimenticola sp.]MCW8977120.1 hypothetical protein [Sedimenticola sp.]
MTPQSTFMIVAKIAAGQLEQLRTLLEAMNSEPGELDPHNRGFPFTRFDRLHVARFLILETLVAEQDVFSFPEVPPRLVFLGDCDGPSDTFIAEMAVLAGPQLRSVFSHCEPFPAEHESLVNWLQARNIKPSANYINWLGRTVTQIREEEALHQALSTQLERIVNEVGRDNPRAIRQQLLSFVEQEKAAARLSLTPSLSTPIGWWLKNLVHKLGVPLILLALSPIFLLFSPYLIYRLRSLEKSDPEAVSRPPREHIQRLSQREDHDVTNPFSAYGEVKPQPFRRYAVRLFLWLLDYASRHVYNRGHLTRVQTIHFARWVMMDNNQRLLFASNYDGSLESYMDDFINKVAWGLNLVFSNGAGYPSTRWLIKAGAEREQKFKHFLRRRQLPTQVWYKAYPGKTAFDLARNSRIREGVEIRQDNDDEIRQWLAEIQV